MHFRDVHVLQEEEWEEHEEEEAPASAVGLGNFKAKDLGLECAVWPLGLWGPWHLGFGM